MICWKWCDQAFVQLCLLIVLRFLFNKRFDHFIWHLDCKYSMKSMLEEKLGSEARNTSTSSIQNFENQSMLDATDRSTSTGFQIPEKVEIARDSNDSSGKIECLENLVCNILPEVYMNGSDVGENSIISNILSLNFDLDDSGLNSPHNLANLLLVETDK